MGKTVRKERRRKAGPRFRFGFELDLHGLRADDALALLERTIYSGRHSSILVIHGCGTGILKRETRRFLKNCPLVRSVEFGESMNLPGGDGVTLARL